MSHTTARPLLSVLLVLALALGGPLSAFAAGQPVAVSNGSDVAEGTTTDTAYVSGAGTVTAILKGIFANSALTSPVPVYFGSAQDINIVGLPLHGVTIAGQYEAARGSISDLNLGTLHLDNRYNLFTSLCSTSGTTCLSLLGNNAAIPESANLIKVPVLGLMYGHTGSLPGGSWPPENVDAAGNQYVLGTKLNDGTQSSTGGTHLTMGGIGPGNFYVPLQVTSAGAVVTSTATPTTYAPAAPATATATNSALMGATYTATPATRTDGQQGQLQTGPVGQVFMTVPSSDGTGMVLAANRNADNLSASTIQGMPTNAAIYGYDVTGNNVDRLTTVTGAPTTGAGLLAMGSVPNSNASTAVAPVATSAVASSLSKASASNVFQWRVTTGATAGYVMLFNATSAPGDGAVTPLDCVAVAANTSIGSTEVTPERYGTGFTIVFSSTGCFTKTASATAFMRYSAL